MARCSVQITKVSFAKAHSDGVAALARDRVAAEIMAAKLAKDPVRAARRRAETNAHRGVGRGPLERIMAREERARVRAEKRAEKRRIRSEEKAMMEAELEGDSDDPEVVAKRERKVALLRKDRRGAQDLVGTYVPVVGRERGHGSRCCRRCATDDSLDDVPMSECRYKEPQECEITIRGLLPGIMYMFRVAAKNALGLGNYSRASISMFTKSKGAWRFTPS